MARIIVPLFLSLLLFSCHHGEKIPDVSDIKVVITTQHFEQDFFAWDSANMYNRSINCRQNILHFTGNIFFPDIKLRS